MVNIIIGHNRLVNDMDWVLGQWGWVEKFENFFTSLTDEKQKT